MPENPTNKSGTVFAYIEAVKLVKSGSQSRYLDTKRPLTFEAFDGKQTI